jgi:hypothetical protein
MPLLDKARAQIAKGVTTLTYYPTHAIKYLEGQPVMLVDAEATAQCFLVQVGVLSRSLFGDVWMVQDRSFRSGDVLDMDWAPPPVDMPVLYLEIT